MILKKIKYAFIPFIFVLIMLSITYFGNQWYAEKMGIVGVDYSYIFLNINQIVPFWDWTIYPYVLAYPFWAFTFFYVSYRSKENMNFMVTLTAVTMLICGIWYFLFQSDVQAWRETSGLFEQSNLTFTQSLVMLIYNSAGPRNALPSMHCLNSWICVLAMREDKTMPWYMKVFIVVIAMSIIISTQTLKQHYIIDLIVGVLLAEVFYWILRRSKLVVKVGFIFDKINQKLHLNNE